MRAPRSSSLIAPSPALLQFLRFQAAEVPFFTPNAIRANPARRPPAWRPRGRDSPARTRAFGSSSCRAAACEASLLPSGFLPRSHDPRPPDSNQRHEAHSKDARPLSAWFALRGWHADEPTGHHDGRANGHRWGSGPTWWEDLKGRTKHKGGGGGQGGGFCGEDPEVDFWTDSSLLSRAKAPNELKLRCTELDENGKVTVIDGEFKKTELIARFGLLPRDLRKIDSSMLPSIIVRPTVILINLVHLRVLVRHDRVLILDVYGSTATYAQSVFMYDLQGKLGQREPAARAVAAAIPILPYEFRALEAVLVSVTSGLEIEFEGVREPVVRVLRALEEDIDREKLRHLLVHSKRLGTFEQKARLVRDAIEGLLEDDGDLSTMYLTEQAQGKKRDPEDHAEIEMLLESYHKVTDEIVESSATLVSEIRNTEEIVKAILDANRNALMLLDLKFSIGTLSIGSGAFVAALYGMNLRNFLEESDLGFWGVSGFSGAFAAVVCLYGLVKLRRVQRVRMWGGWGGDGGPAGRTAGWSEVEAMRHMRIDTARAERARRLKEGKREGWREEMRGLLDGPQAEPAKARKG